MRDDEKPHRETIIDQPSMTSVVTKEYLVLPFSDVVIHKRFFQYWTLFAFLGTSVLWAIGMWTNWYSLILMAMGQGFIDNLWLGPAIAAIVILSIYASHLSKKGGGRKRQREVKEQPAKS